MQRFMQAARPALLTVATPRITSSEGEPMYIADGLTEDIAAVLTPLADTCPDLHHLEVSGDVGSPLLEAFGTCCRKLTILTATDAPAATLERLSELLPRIKTTHVSVSRRDQNFVEHGVVRLSTYRRAISSCCTLTRLDVPGDQMTAEDWRALPSCTTELVWSTAPSLQHVQKNFECALGPPLGVKLPNLKKLTFSDRAFRMSVAMLANLLRAAPQLSCLGTGNLWARCGIDAIPDLASIHAHSAAYLVPVLSNKAAGQESQSPAVFASRTLRLFLLDTQAPKSCLAQFLARLPVLPKFSSLLLVGAWSLEQPFLPAIARSFPGVLHLQIVAKLAGSSLPCLKAFPLLRSVSLATRSVYSPLELGALCLQVPSLEYLGVWHMSVADQQSLGAVLLAWGSRVQLAVVSTPRTC